MTDFEKLLLNWKVILNKLESNNGSVHPLNIGDKATSQEIQQKEKEVGYNLPPSYKEILNQAAKSLSFYYSFSQDTMIPIEFDEIFSGELFWDIEMLQNLDDLADELDEKGQGVGENLRGKLEFSHASNGDIYAFDMTVPGDEKPVIYWDHEDNTVTYIADSFMDYLEKITDLKCIGSEKWQLEYFLCEHGLDNSSNLAIKWKTWFDSFSETHIQDIRGDMKQLISFIAYRKKLDNESIQAFQAFDKKYLFEELLNTIHNKENYTDKKIICEIIGEVLGSYANNWVKNLWETNNYNLNPKLRSYLTSRSLGDSGINLVFKYLEDETKNKISGYTVRDHLYFFHSNEVITWMESKVRSPVNDGWSELFIMSSPSWEQVKRWIELDERHQATVIHALETYIKKTNENEFVTIYNLPSKEKFRGFLGQLREKQILRKRIKSIDFVIQNINLFY